MRRVATSYHIMRVKKKQKEARLIARPAMRVFWPVCCLWVSPVLFRRRIAPPICTRKEITSLNIRWDRKRGNGVSQDWENEEGGVPGYEDGDDVFRR